MQIYRNKGKFLHKEGLINSYRIGFIGNDQHDCGGILGNQHGGRDVMWKRSIGFPSCPDEGRGYF